MTLLKLGLILNHPDINTNTFTQRIDNDSKRILVKEDMGLSVISATVGAPSEK